MSEIKVNSIKGVGASTAAITVNNSDGTCTANITNNLSNRNLIINGAMQVAQRGTSSTANSYSTVDRFRVDDGGHDEASTKEQAAVTSGGAYDSGFRKCLKITNGDQTNGAGASDYIQILTKIEAQDVASSGWKYTSTSSFITVSFWIKSSVAQAFSGSIRTVDGTAQSFKFDTPSLTADTWTRVTKTIPGNSNLTFDNNNDRGLELYLFPFIGTTYTTANSNSETWVTAAGDTYANNMTSTWWTTDNATFELTGVQIEVGSVATDFEHRSYADELRRCQRYYAKYSSIGSNYAQFLVTSGYSTDTDSRGMFNFVVEMRVANPSFTYSGSSGNVTDFVDLGGKAINLFSISDAGTGKNTGIRCIFSGSNTSNGFSHVIRANNTANAFFAFDAEL